MHFSLDDNCRDIIAEAQMRQGILSKEAGHHWRLETGFLRTTRDAVAPSLLRYALTVTGSCYSPDLMRSVNTQIVNIGERKIGGASRSARIASLHFTVVTDSACEASM